MAENTTHANETAAAGGDQLQSGSYEIIRNRLLTHGKDLRQRLDQLNAARKEVFGAIETKLLASERITTDNNCVPRDMVCIGSKILFGYNVFIGLRSETVLTDVFAVYDWQDGAFNRTDLKLIEQDKFITDFKNLYKYYRQTVFAKFAVIGPHLFMVFRIGKSVTDVKTFKWLLRGDELVYLDNRSDHEFVFPPQHEFEWRRTTQDMHRGGANPHISIEDRIFVETVGGDLTVKIEDNTASGEGIYAEPVDNADQTLSDAEIYYAIVGNIILLKILPYQETRYRYLVYNEKVQQCTRIDAIREACVLLPDDHGLIFPRGCYLQTGERKQFDTDLKDMVYEKRIDSPNGEDYLYIFFNREQGAYVLLSYNLIEQKVATPIVCHGYLIMKDGTLLYFKDDGEPKKHHAVQTWQTPYYGPDHAIPVQQESELYKIGNKDIVKCMAECTELLNLSGKEESFVNLYIDISRKAQDILDSYFWIKNAATFTLADPLRQIQEAATAAIEEYEKVVRTRRNTRDQIDKTHKKVREIIDGIDFDTLTGIGQFVEGLSQLRSVRGEVVSLKDLNYTDLELVEALETEVAEVTEKLSGLCVEFLLTEEALTPYQELVAANGEQVKQVSKVTEVRELEQQIGQTATELDMLTEIVSNLKIEDATQTVAIIDNISLVFAELNKVKAVLKNRLNDLATTESKAEFASQIKLIDQTTINYLDVCHTPDKCDEYLTKVVVQLETLESKFADFDEFVLELTDKREEIYNAFESRKAQLVAARNQKAAALMTASERMLKGIENRIRDFADINQINGYFASDLMVERVRETIAKLLELGDSVKADDIKSRLKTLQQDGVRQLKDKQALYEDGETIIRLGDHRFSVNKQPLEGSLVRRDDQLYFHLSGTGFYQHVLDEGLESTRDVWDMQAVSENNRVYRGEYLAYLLLRELKQAPAELDSLRQGGLEAILNRVRQFMAPRYAEGYVKGVHDHDAALILERLIHLESTIGLLRYTSRTRALAAACWDFCSDEERKQLLARKIEGIGHLTRVFEDRQAQQVYIDQLQEILKKAVDANGLFDAQRLPAAAEYLFFELSEGDGFVLSQTAGGLKAAFEEALKQRKSLEHFQDSIASLANDQAGRYRLVRDWIRGYLAACEPALMEYDDEIATLYLESNPARTVVDQSVAVSLEGMLGSHRSITEGRYELNYCHFIERLQRHVAADAPQFITYQKTCQAVVERYSDQLRLDEYKPRVLTTFVRNQLIDKVYLPLIGDNLAKQIGSEGADKRTDRQGLLLLISPPGYGKTTLMEYVANRLGLIFMKINGPAIGSRVTSFDPEEAPNAAAREELAKLNTAFEMGDNVMIYVDDIQHTSPEFLQKFISLCDAQRRVEGVYNGRSRTYDLRGKRVCVVMAGNPYTESGEKFKIPDMLANRADTYNIGDIVGDNYDTFVMSYLENCLTANPVLSKLAVRSQADVYTIMQLAETGQKEGMEFEGSYSADELNEFVETMKKLFVVRNVVLRVNQEYIRSAAQSDAYRTEPPFLLQGSYRNMNRIAGRVVPLMNEQELWTLIFASYEQDAQTLTSGAESNLLKFRELTDRLTDDQARRWADIKRTFNRNLLLGGDTEDKAAQIVRMLGSFGDGLTAIRETLAAGVGAMSQAAAKPLAEPVTQVDQQAPLREVVDRLGDMVAAVREKGDGETQQMQANIHAVVEKMSEVAAAIKDQQQLFLQQQQIHDATEIKQDADMLLSVLEEQYKTMQTWLMRVVRNKEGREKYVQELVDRFGFMVTGYSQLIDFLKEHYQVTPPVSEADKKPDKSKRAESGRNKKSPS